MYLFRSYNGALIRTQLIAVFVCMMTLTLHDDSSAQVIWDNNTGTPNPFFHTGSNWVGNNAPGSTDRAQFDLGGTYEVWWNATTESLTPDVGFLSVQDGDVTFRSVQLGSLRELVINGSGGNGLNTDFQITGASTNLNLFGVHLHGLGAAEILDGAHVVLGGPVEPNAKITVAGAEGFEVDGNLLVQAGSDVQAFNSYIGRHSSSNGEVTVSGAGSQWTNDDKFHVGHLGTGTLNITNEGIVESKIGSLGHFGTSVGVTNVSDTGSSWNIQEDLSVGTNGQGTLNVNNGGAVANRSGIIGEQIGSQGTVEIDNFGSSWNNADDLTVGYFGEGSLSIEDSSTVTSQSAYIGRFSTSTGSASLSWYSTWTNSGSLYVGQSGDGELSISWATMNNDNAYVGRNTGSQGNVSVTNYGAWNSSGSVYIGSSGVGSLNVNSVGYMASNEAFIGHGSQGSGVATVSSGGDWINSGEMTVGNYGPGQLNVLSGGYVSNGDAYIARNDGSAGDVNVNNATWDTTGNLFVGGDDSLAGGTGTLNIDVDALVTVSGTTKIWETGTVNLSGGRFEFGETSLADFGQINATSGSLAGNLIHGDYTNVANLATLHSGPVDLVDVILTNSGSIYGNASLGTGMSNLEGGEVETVVGERMRFAGSGNNSGEFNNFGGRIRFDQGVTNHNGGFISGRGAFTANGGWTNQGVMAFSGGFTDIHGDIDNQASGQIVTSGGGITTFYDDVVHNGVEIRTSAQSMSVFLGDVSGSGPFTGTGTVFLEGDLRPGNSPGKVQFEGDLVLGSGAGFFAEIGGRTAGLFDQLMIEGDLTLAGQLDVALINGFQLTFNDEFLIADVGGELLGQFDGKDEGSLVGNFGGMDLYISYAGGDGNDLTLFTAVPEPSAFHFASFVCAAGAMLLRRRNLRTT